MLYRNVVKPIFFKMDPEKAHHLTIDGMRRAARVPGALSLLSGLYSVQETPDLAMELWGLHFPNMIGLAAGLDKNGEAVPGFSSIGFGFVEVGTVTPLSQEGNDLPRLFRLPEDLGLINRMGFNNKGAKAMAHQLSQLNKRTIPVAVNIGKNKNTPNEEAESDYRKCIRTLYSHGDFFVVNISSPNTPGLRSLQHGEDLRKLLLAVNDELSQQQASAGGAGKPVLVKIAPDLTAEELEGITETIVQSGVSGIIASNTTLSREGLRNANARETGGLSGRPLFMKSTETVRSIYRQTKGAIPIIGSGGIFTAQDAYDKVKAGASMIELYSALIYHGPHIVKEIHSGLRELLKRDGFTHISQAIGKDA
ncbi:diguanylate cyclase [Paenibacillus swuensis]|uniref:Dihydroorotate dehydrogenase (quinone) n=1 Tax=Paenibacillus swuensis TaxID=1178515 RepID=A0A172TMN4_9BACL|nr:quinone-dependent dihydroorotate dehydrogenase [Paenibacillus swuensis]ANE48280.1 diguanylate cyclase [Paenibacillus swuensis]